jgi:hypothetical protein
LYDIFFLGYVFTKEGNVRSDKILIYKIGDNADFEQVEDFIRQPIEGEKPENHQPQDTKFKIQIIAISSTVLGVGILTMALVIIYKKYPKKKDDILFIE